MLSRLQGIPGVVQLYDQGMLSNGSFAIIMERLKGPDLFDYISDRECAMDEDVAQFLFAQIFQIVIRCFQNGVVHRDIKDENIMFDENDKLKLIDFGCATFVNVNDGDGKLRKMEGTRAFTIPEWLKMGFYYAESSTVWQLGSLLYNTLSGDITIPQRCRDRQGARYLAPIDQLSVSRFGRVMSATSPFGPSIADQDFDAGACEDDD